MCVTLILSSRMLPRATEPPAKTKVRTSAPKSEERPSQGGSWIGNCLEYPSHHHSKKGDGRADGAPWAHKKRSHENPGTRGLHKTARETLWQRLQGQTVILIRSVTTRLSFSWSGSDRPASWKPRSNRRIDMSPSQRTPGGRPHGTSTPGNNSRRGKTSGTPGLHRTFTHGKPRSGSMEPREDVLNSPDPAATSSLRGPWGPVFRLEASMTTLSCVIETCSHLVERMTRQTSDRLGLPGLGNDGVWVTLVIPTSHARPWLIYARYGEFPENILCVEHAIVRGAIVDTTASPPRMALHGSVYELHRRNTDGPDGPLHMRLPLQPDDLFMPELEAPSFLPSTHWLYETPADTTLVGDIARMAGLEHPRDLQRWVNHYLRSDDELEQWMLGDMVGVEHHTHLPWLLRATTSRGDSDSDSDGRGTMHQAGSLGSEPPGKTTTTFHRSANMPRVRVGASGTGNSPPPRYPGDATVLLHDDEWWRTAEGVIDMTASRPYMSLAFAKGLSYNRESLNTGDANEISELDLRPGGWNQMSFRPHRTRYWGLGTLTVGVCFFRDEDMPCRVLNVEFMVFDDSTLPKRSSMDMVLHPAFATQLPERIQGSARSDAVSQSFSRGLTSGSFFTTRPTITQATGRLWPYSAPGTLPSDEGAHDTRRMAVWRGLAQRFSQVLDAPEDSTNNNLTRCWCSPECSMPTPLGADTRRKCSQAPTEPRLLLPFGRQVSTDLPTMAASHPFDLPRGPVSDPCASGSSPLQPHVPAHQAEPQMAQEPVTPPIGPVLKLSRSMGKLSCVNESCDHLIEHITTREARRLHLPHLRQGRTWVTLSLTVSPGRTWLIYARYAPSSVYPENILCVHHAVVRRAVIDATANPPRMRFHDSVFKLHRRDPGLDGALYLQLPLDPCGLFMPTF